MTKSVFLSQVILVNLSFFTRIDLQSVQVLDTSIQFLSQLSPSDPTSFLL